MLNAAALGLIALFDAVATAPTDQIPFTEEAVARGLDFHIPAHSGEGRGIAFCDLDGDGDPDLLAAGGQGDAFGIWENDGTGHFTSRAAGSGVGAVSFASGLCTGDYDGDRLPDVYVSRWWQPNGLLRNLGGFQFVDVAPGAGVANNGLTSGCAWADFDGDGLLDLYVSNMTGGGSAENALYRNNGSGSFTDVASQFGVAALGFTWQARFIDYDRDRDPDLYINNDRGANSQNCEFRNFFFRNDGGVLLEATDETGTLVCADAMGMAIGDFDGNGWEDIYVSNSEQGNPLLLNQGNGNFAEVAEQAGVQSNTVGWGTVFFDFDNDGDLDLYLCNDGDPNRLYLNGDAWPCPDGAATLGVDAAAQVRSFQCVVADVDLDGDQDLLVAGWNDRLRLFINHEGERRNWFRARIIGAAPNPDAYGAAVDVRTGSVWQTRSVHGSGGYKSHDESTLHFGLASAARVDEVVIDWPDGQSRTLRGYPANRVWTLCPQSMLGDADLDGQVGSDDFFTFLDCFLSQGGDVLPGCEFADFDGDASFSSTDFFAFVARFLQQ